MPPPRVPGTDETLDGLGANSDMRVCRHIKTVRLLCLLVAIHYTHILHKQFPPTVGIEMHVLLGRRLSQQRQPLCECSRAKPTQGRRRKIIPTKHKTILGLLQEKKLRRNSRLSTLRKDMVELNLFSQMNVSILPTSRETSAMHIEPRSCGIHMKLLDHFQVGGLLCESAWKQSSLLQQRQVSARNTRNKAIARQRGRGIRKQNGLFESSFIIAQISRIIEGLFRRSSVQYQVHAFAAGKSNSQRKTFTPNFDIPLLLGDGMVPNLVV